VKKDLEKGQYSFYKSCNQAFSKLWYNTRKEHNTLNMKNITYDDVSVRWIHDTYRIYMREHHLANQIYYFL